MDSEVKTISGDYSTRSELIPILQEVQETEGFLSEKSLEKISKILNISQTEIYAVATFYSQFKFKPPAKHKIKVCLGTACHVKGGEKVMEAVKRSLNLDNGDTTSDLEYSVERVACIGCCALAPCIRINNHVYGELTSKKVREFILTLSKGERDEG